MNAKRILIAVAVVALAGSIVAIRTLRGTADEDALVLSGTIEADDVLVGSRLGGRIAEVLVREGERVAAGQPIARFETADLRARHADAVAAVARARAALDKAQDGFRPEEIDEARAHTASAAARLQQAKHGPRPQEIDQAEAQLHASEADLRVARATYERVRALAEDGVLSRQQLDEARAAFERAEGLHDAAAERLRLLLSVVSSQ